MPLIQFIFTNERISLENLGDGRHVVKVTPSKTKILAYIVDGKVTRYEAEDKMGNRQPLLSISQDIPDRSLIPGVFGDGFCQVCTYDAVYDSILCYTLIECPPSDTMILDH